MLQYNVISIKVSFISKLLSIFLPIILNFVLKASKLKKKYSISLIKLLRLGIQPLI